MKNNNLINKNINYKNNKKFNFKEKKDNTLNSLSEVELFLRNFKKLKKYLNLYKILK